jgi:hypothetical protein
MLRSVIADYLTKVEEREFDLPLLALLPAMGFYDVHYTHGSVEFGKDIIAKKLEQGVVIQYAFQSKAGDINQSTWRNSIMGQLLEAVYSGLSHPNFDKGLGRQVVLVTTGRLTGNSAISVQELNESTLRPGGYLPVVVWDHETLLDSLARFGIESIQRVTAVDFVSYGDFHTLYGKAIQGRLSEREIEQHSRYWISAELSLEQRILGAVLEAEILGSQCYGHGFYYESIHAHLCVLRCILFAIHSTTNAIELEHLLELHREAQLRITDLCRTYVSGVQRAWNKSGRDMASLVPGIAVFIGYLVHLARILEMAGLLYFLEDAPTARQDLAIFIRQIIDGERGCGRIPSDQYGVSLVLPVLALIRAGMTDTAQKLLRRSAIWLCDRYSLGAGLASLGADAKGECAVLLGYPFDFVPVEAIIGSFTATAICDLCAFLEDHELYSDVVNDIKATGIAHAYWQAKDTIGLFDLEGEDVITYPNIEYADEFDTFESMSFAEHLRYEPRSFRVADITDAASLMGIALLLRDRYFPSLWLGLGRPN